MPLSIGCLTNLEESSYVHVSVAAAMAAADVLRIPDCAVPVHYRIKIFFMMCSRARVPGRNIMLEGWDGCGGYSTDSILFPFVGSKTICWST